MNEIKINAALAELKSIMDFILERAINSAGDLAMAQAEIARLQAALPVEPSESLSDQVHP